MSANTGPPHHPADTKEEAELSHVNSVMGPEKPTHVEDGERDYTGTARKTDPEEIRLVRKLDLWIMVRLPLTRLLMRAL